MSASYDPTLIATSILSYARARFRDVGGLSGTTVTKPLLQDEEYSGFIARLGEREGLAQAAESLAASFAQKVQSFAEAGGVDISWPRRPDFYLALAKSIRIHGVDMGSSAYVVHAGSPSLPQYGVDGRLFLSPRRSLN